MKITDEAKSLITEALASNNCDCLQVTLQQSCCGTSLNFALAKLKEGEKPISINSVPVMMDNQAQLRTATITLTVEDGEIIIEGDTPSCCC